MRSPEVTEFHELRGDVRVDLLAFFKTEFRRTDFSETQVFHNETLDLSREFGSIKTILCIYRKIKNSISTDESRYLIKKHNMVFNYLDLILLVIWRYLVVKYNTAAVS